MKKPAKKIQHRSWKQPVAEQPTIRVRQAFSELQTAREKITASRTTRRKESKNLRNLITDFTSYIAFLRLHAKLFFTRGGFARKVSSLIFRTAAVLLTLALIYITSIDTHFITNKFNINFNNESYLENKGIEDLLLKIEKEKIMGIIPLNSYWFINTDSLTELAKRHNPDIKKVILTNKTWPNSADITITTEPVAATLVFDNKSYIISKEGKILGDDSVFQRTNVIQLNSFSTPENFLTQEKLNAFDKNLLEKIFFTVFLQTQLTDLNYSVSDSRISSDLPLDTDSIITVNKTKLFFSLDGLNAKNLTDRITKLFSSETIRSQINDGSITTIDLRFAKNVYICFANTECSKNTKPL